jgi:DNA/RNA-binding domain of Phe-tRNA-synthetase-like protein
MFTVSQDWKTAYPNASIGILVMHQVANPASHDSLNQKKEMLEKKLRTLYMGFSRPEFETLPAMQAYQTYYKPFKKTYHVLLQFESVVLKGKPIPNVAALVEAMFMAEIENMLLTAGHDLNSLKLPVQIKVANGSESYTLMNGQEQILKSGDMYISDGKGIISSILYGPDNRTQIKSGTQSVLFTVYAPPGIKSGMLLHHLKTIRDNVLIVSPDGQVELLDVFGSA